MNFAFPQFLWALLALSIPIIIHLFNFRRTTRIFFSNNRLLRQIKEETTQKRRLKQYLVLASRLLFIFFLVLAFAQPYLPAKEQVSAARNIILYLDNSYSMSAQVSEKTRALDAGSAFIQEIVDVFPADTRYRLITNDFAPFSNNYKTKAEILDLLTQIRLSAVSRSANDIIRRIGKENSGTDIFWISDFQKSTLLSKAELSIDSANQIHLVPVSFSQTSNVFVDSIYLENPFVIGGEKNTIHIRLRNVGSRITEGLVVKLVINGIQTGATSVNIEPNSFSEASFDLATGIQGLNEARISFSDFPISFDNDFYFTLNFTEVIRVVEIKSESSPSYVERVYGNKELFSYRGFSSSNVDYGYLSRADVVILNGLNTIEASLITAVEQNHDRIGAIIVIPGDAPDLTAYQRVTGIPNLSTIDVDDMMAMDNPDFSNPFFENVFEERSTTLEMPLAKPVLDLGIDRSAILKFRNTRSFLSRNGDVFLMASPLQKEYSNFFNNALFVPVMYRIAASAKRSEPSRYFTLNSSIITLRADSIFGDEPVRLIGEQEIVPPQRRVGDRYIMEMPKFSIDPGYFYAMFRSDTLDLFAFNLEKPESDLTQLEPEEMRQLFGGGANITIFEGASPESFGNEVKERYLGTPLWKYALILALLFLLLEVLFIRFLK